MTGRGPTRRVALGLLAGASVPGGTARADDRIDLPPDWRDRLAAIRAEESFAPTDLYAGYQPESHRAAAEALVDGLIDRLLADLEAHPSRAWLRSQVRDTYDWFRLSDTEDRDRCAEVLAGLLGALGVDGPDQEGIDEWVGGFGLIVALTHPQLEG